MSVCKRWWKKKIERLKQARNCYHDSGKEKTKAYYENDKERLRKQARNKVRELYNKEKDLKREYGWNGYRNMLREEKEKLFLFFVYDKRQIKWL